MNDDRTIEYVRIADDALAALGIGGAKEVYVTYVGDGDNEELLFSYYPDEISFTAAELQGLTRREALRLHYDRDVAYLRSP